MAYRDPTALQSEESTVEVSVDNRVTTLFLPGAASISVSGGDAESRTPRDLQDNQRQITGKAGVPTVSIALSFYAPQHPTMRLLKKAKEDGDIIHVRYSTKEREFYTSPSADTITVDAMGAVTFTQTVAAAGRPDPTSPGFEVGTLIKTSSESFVIVSFDADGANMMVRDADALDTAGATAITTAAQYKMAVPSLRRPWFACRIVNFDTDDLGEQSQLSTTLELAPRAALPDWEVVPGAF